MNTAVAFFAGFLASSGFGEDPGPTLALTFQSNVLRGIASVELVPKRESGEGWIGGLDLDVGRVLFLGLGFHHRDGGRWTKQSAWIRGGIQSRNLRLVLRHDLTSENRVSIAEGIGEFGTDRLRLRTVVGGGTYESATGREWGYFVGAQVGLRP